MKALEEIDITREASLSQKEIKNEWVLDALCELTQVGKVATASLRHLSGRTGFGTHSVRGALRRLQDAKRIERQRRSYARFDYADRYRILDQPRIKIPGIEWTNFGLGPSAWAIYQRLDPTNLSKVTDLASWTQQSQPTVRKRLRELEAAGLAIRQGVRWRGSDGTQSLEPVRDAALRVRVERQEVLAEEQKRWRRIVGAYLQRMEDKRATFRDLDMQRNRMELERRRKRRAERNTIRQGNTPHVQVHQAPELPDD